METKDCSVILEDKFCVVGTVYPLGNMHITSNSNPFARIPVEVIISNILPHISKDDLLSRVMLINRRFSNLCRDSSLWKTLVIPWSMSFDKAMRYLDHCKPSLTNLAIEYGFDDAGPFVLHALQNCPELTDLSFDLSNLKSKFLTAVVKAMGEFGVCIRRLTVWAEFAFESAERQPDFDHELLGQSLAKMTRLTKLKIYSSLNSHQMMAITTACPNLNHFDAYCIPDKAFNHFLNSAKSRLRVLSFEASEASDNPGDSTFPRRNLLSQLHLLLKLTIKRIDYKVLDRAALDAIFSLPLLEYLHLEIDCPIAFKFSSDDFVDILTKMKPKKLSFLGLTSFTVLDDACLEAIIAFCPRLKGLSLKLCCFQNRCKIKGNGLKLILFGGNGGDNEYGGKLEHLELEVCRVGRVMTIIENEEVIVSKLRQLSLFQSNFKRFQKGMMFRILRLMPNLEVLDFKGGPIRRNELVEDMLPEKNILSLMSV